MFLCQLIEAARRWTTRVRHENVDLSETLEAGGDELFDLCGDCHVSRHTEDVGAGLIRDCRGRFRQRFGVARAKDQRGSFSGELFSDSASQSTTSRGNG